MSRLFLCDCISKENPATFPGSRGEILKILIKTKNLKSKSTYRYKYALCNIVISKAFVVDTPLRFSWLGKPVSRCGTIIGANFTHCFVYCAEIESQQRTVAALVSF